MMTHDKIKAELTDGEIIDYEAAGEWIKKYKYRTDGTAGDFKQLCKLVRKNLESLAAARAGSRALREMLGKYQYCGSHIWPSETSKVVVAQNVCLECGQKKEICRKSKCALAALLERKEM